MTIDDVRHYVAQRRLIYQRALAQADKMLQAVVSQDPSLLAACEEVQKEYTATVAATPLRVLEQPASPQSVIVVAGLPSGGPVTLESESGEEVALIPVAAAGDGGEPIQS